MNNQDSAAKDVQSAWDFWLSQNPVTVEQLVEKAVRKSVTAWLDAHTDEIVEAIAKRLAKEMRGRPS